MINKAAIRNVIDSTDSFWGRIFTLSIQALIILSLVTFSLETLPDLSQEVRDTLKFMELIIVILFTIEYVLRIIAAENKIKFMFSFYGIVDLLAILPFYLSAGLDILAVRLFRLLRLIRVFKLFRYSKAINTFHRALVIVKEELILFGFMALIMLYLSAVGIYYFENTVQPDQFQSIFHCLWWAITTLTTVGYGDMYPITAGGKIFTFIILSIGLGIVAIPTGLIASALSQARESEKE